MMACSHKTFMPGSAPVDFECDLCGLEATASYLLFKDSVLKCSECGLLIHERCRGRSLTPHMMMYAANRARERHASESWKKTLLPELRTKQSALEQRLKSMQETVKKARLRADESLWNRSWTLRTFASKFYSENNPEKNEPSQLNPLIGYYSKTPARCRLFFERLALAYPEHKASIFAQALNMKEALQNDERELQELDMLEGSLEQMSDLKDELQREIQFPLNPAFGVAPKWRLRLGFEGITLAMGDFFLDHVRARIRVTSGIQEGLEKSYHVSTEVLGIDDKKNANFAVSIKRLGLAGPMLPVNYFADSLSISFDCNFQVRADYHPSVGDDKRKKGAWKISPDSTKCEVSNLKHSFEGASIPMPSRVLDLVLSSLLTYGLKQALLALLPAELGDYIVRLNRPVCSFEWRIKIESLFSKEVRMKTPLDQLPSLDRLDIPQTNMEILQEVLRKLSPRTSLQENKNSLEGEIWTIERALALHRRYIRDSAEKDRWRGLWNEALKSVGSSLTCDQLWEHIDKLDNKPCSFEIDCLNLKITVAVRELSRVVRMVLLRAVSKKSTTSVEMRADMKRTNSSSASSPKALPNGPRATSEQARAAVSEVCTSFEEAVESALSHALRRLRFSLEFVVAGGLMSLNLKEVKMVSRLGEQFEAPIPAKWLGEKVLQSATAVWPWRSSFQVDQTSGALRFVFTRDGPLVKLTDHESHPPFGELIVQVAELEAKIAFDGLVEELMRRQRQNLFGRGEDSELFSESLTNGDTFHNTDNSNTVGGGGGNLDTYVMMRVGYKGNVGMVARGLGMPRIETSLSHVLLTGPVPSLIRIVREFRFGKDMASDSAFDDLDAILGKLERKIHLKGPDQRLLTSVLLDLVAEATEEGDLLVELSLPENDPRYAFTFADDVDLVTVVSEILQMIG